MTTNPLQVIFISFQSIYNGVPSGVVKGILRTAAEFSKLYKIPITYYLSYNEGYKGQVDVRSISNCFSLYNKLIDAINRRFLKIQSHYIRFHKENLFDYFLKQRIKKPIILISSAYLVRTLQKNKSLGGINIFLAGNPHDFNIYELLLHENLKYGIKLDDAYTYKKRISFISKSILSYDHIITFSEVTYNSYNKYISSDRLSKITANTFPYTKLYPTLNLPKKSGLSFCFVSHPFWLKGLPYLLEAWSNVDRTGIKLHIAGTIDKQLQKLIDERYSTLENVEYHGWVNDLNQFLRSSQVCIVPSLLDAGPATVAEAMYCGLPVIVTDGCGSHTLVENEFNGFVVPAKNSDAIADKINWFIKNKEKINTMGHEATNTIKKLEKSDQNKKIAEHIMTIIEKLKKNEDTSSWRI